MSRSTPLSAALALCVAFVALALLRDWPFGEWLALGVGALLLLAQWHERRAADQARHLLVQALDAMQAGVALYDADDRLEVANADFRRLYAPLAAQWVPGLRFEDLLRQAVQAGLVPEAAGQGEAWIAARMAQHRSAAVDPVAAPMLRRMADGRWRRIAEQRLPDGGVIAFSIDVTELVQQREALQVAQARAESAHEALEDAIEALPEGFALYGADDRLVLCNQRYREIYPASAPAMTPGARFEDVVRYGLERGQYPQAAADPVAWLAERVRRHLNPSGEPILQELEGNRWLRIDERKTRSGGVAGVRADVTEMVHARQRLESLSTTDALTGAGNRRLFDQRLTDELRRAQRQGQPLALLMVDIDHFKRYNDRYGHPAGDAALQRVVSMLRQQARRPGELVARYGGEEFVLLLPHNDEAAAFSLAERCLAAVALAAIEHADSPTSAHVTLSIGVAVHNAAAATSAEDAAAFVARADAALYEAKQRGRARVIAAAQAGGSERMASARHNRGESGGSHGNRSLPG